MKMFPSSAECCPADLTAETAMRERTVFDPATGRREHRRAKMIFHVLGDARFWHWSDRVVSHETLPAPRVEVLA